MLRDRQKGVERQREREMERERRREVAMQMAYNLQLIQHTAESWKLKLKLMQQQSGGTWS